MSFRILAVRIVLVLFFCGGIFACLVPPAFSQETFSAIYFQGYVGAAEFDEDAMTFTETSLSDPDVQTQADLSSMPYIGFSSQFGLTPGPTHIGIDTSILFGWRSRDTSVAAGNGQIRVKIDSELWLLDIAMGLYGQTMLGDRWRLYGAVGPLLLFGSYSDDTSEENVGISPYQETKDSRSDSAFGYGGYAKIGLEYGISPSAFIGIAARGVTTNLEFDDALDDNGLDGVQGFLTFTRRY